MLSLFFSLFFLKKRKNKNVVYVVVSGSLALQTKSESCPNSVDSEDGSS